MAGGLYDQHPELLDQWRYIFAERAQYERAKAEQQEREAKARQNAPRVPTGRRRR